VSEELELRQRQAQQRKAEQAAKAETDRRRQRRRIRIEVVAFVISALTVAGILYYDTTKVADDFFAVHIRSGQVVDVHDGGRIYRIPVLDRVVLIDKGARPLPALRRTARAANGATVSYEAVLNFTVREPEKYWLRFRGVDAEAGKRVLQSAENAIAAEIARREERQLAGSDAATSLAGSVARAIDAALADAGLGLRELKFTGLRVVP